MLKYNDAAKKKRRKNQFVENTVHRPIMVGKAAGLILKMEFSLSFTLALRTFSQ